MHDNRDLWDRHAEENPLWAILSDPAKVDRRWNLSRFFQTGVREIDALRYELGARGIALGAASALDFGCGVGRLTQALAPHFGHVVGVDISPKMVAIAASLNRFPDKVRYVANLDPELAQVGPSRFDFVLSRITLQHIEPHLSVRYLAALCGRLSKGGVIVFQVPSDTRPIVAESAAPTVRAMPDEAYSAAIDFRGIRDGSLAPGGRITLDLEIANLSSVEWAQQRFGRMTVGNHWREAASGRMLVRDDGRTGIPERVRPGQVCLVPLSLTLPREPGAYDCELDLSHEGLLWFEDKGSATTRLSVDVGSDAVVVAPPIEATVARPAAPLDEPFAPVDPAWAPADGGGVEPYPMYAVPKETVLQVIAEAGLELIDVRDDHSCGADWVSYQYYARSAEFL